MEPFEHDFHGPPPPPQEGRPRKYKKRVRLPGVEPPIKKQRPKHDPSTPEERKELHEKIMRYVDSFPEHIFPEAMGVSPETPFDELTYVLQRIQQRINAKQELQVLQSGLVTMCMATEFGSSMIPKNPIKLKGFGTNVSSHISMFDDCLKQIACKYGGGPADLGRGPDIHHARPLWCQHAPREPRTREGGEARPGPHDHGGFS